VRQLILHQINRRQLFPFSEGTILSFAEGIKKDFSLHDVFPWISVKRMRRRYSHSGLVTPIVLTVAVNPWNI